MLYVSTIKLYREMQTKNKVLILVGVAVVIGAGIYFWNKKSKINSIEKDIAEGGKKKSWRFGDNKFTTGSQSTSSLGFKGETKPPFQIGDKVTVIQDVGAKYPSYDGVTTVQDIYPFKSMWIVDVAKARKGDSPVNAGVINSV
jgi:hypothetical protein